MKRIGVVVRKEKKAEALRVSVGLTLADDKVDVFILDEKLERDKEINEHLEALEMMESNIYTNNKKNNFEYMELEKIAEKLLEYDVVVPF